MRARVAVGRHKRADFAVGAWGTRRRFVRALYTALEDGAQGSLHFCGDVSWVLVYRYAAERRTVRHAGGCHCHRREPAAYVVARCPDMVVLNGCRSWMSQNLAVRTESGGSNGGRWGSADVLVVAIFPDPTYSLSSAAAAATARANEYARV